MKMHDIHIDEDDFEIFSMLDSDEKLEFLADIQHVGKTFSTLKNMSKNRHDRVSEKPKMPSIEHRTFKINNVPVTVILKKDLLLLSSNKLSAIRHIAYRFVDDGYLIKKLPRANFLMKLHRYHTAYRICGAVSPICPN